LTIAVSLKYQLGVTQSFPTLSCRKATNADGPQVEQLVFSVLGEYGLAPEPEGVDRDLRDLEGFYLARGGWFGVWVDEAGTIFGSAGLGRVDERTCELRKMYLHASKRGKGQGRAMLERALAEAKRLGFQRVILETATVLKEAVQLYERYGFRKTEPEGHCAKRCDLVMVRDL
jgi:putative acetyltransferase